MEDLWFYIRWEKFVSKEKNVRNKLKITSTSGLSASPFSALTIWFSLALSELLFTFCLLPCESATECKLSYIWSYAK